MLILDAGTGIRKMHTLPEGIRNVHMFITHLHWDHIIGFPQWPLLTSHPDLNLHLYSLERSYDRFYGALERSASRPLYTRSLEDLFEDFHYHELRPGDLIEVNSDLGVACELANHPYRALAYRVQHQRRVLTFIPDTSLTAAERRLLRERKDRITALAGDCDWLIYDAALTPEEYEILPHWGHSTMEQAIEQARESSAREIILFHHSPQRTDKRVDAMLAEQQKNNPDMLISAAYAGMSLVEESL